MSRRRCRCGSVSIFDDSVVARRSACTAWRRWPVVAGPQRSTPPRSLSAGGRSASGDSDTGVPSGAQLLLGSPRRPGSPWCGRRLRSAAGSLRLWLRGRVHRLPQQPPSQGLLGLRDLVQRVEDRGCGPPVRGRRHAAPPQRRSRSTGRVGWSHVYVEDPGKVPARSRCPRQRAPRP